MLSCASHWTIRQMLDRITHDPNVLAGRATLRGLRISVAHVVNLVTNGMTPEQIVAEYPDLGKKRTFGRRSHTRGIMGDFQEIESAPVVGGESARGGAPAAGAARLHIRSSDRLDR
jgi:uncharacterized protein (DUF433 family)